MTRSHAVSSFKSWIFDKSSHMSSRISPLLNKKPGGFFFLKRLIWGMNSSKYIIRFWHVRRLQLFSVINPVFYWHATGMLEGISSASNGSSISSFFVINFQCNLWQKLRMRIWGWGAEVCIKICFPWQTDGTNCFHGEQFHLCLRPMDLVRPAPKVHSQLI